MDTYQAVKKCFLFTGLPASDLDSILSIGQTLSFKARDSIFFEGDPAKGFHVILDGTVKIFKLSSEGREQILHIFGPGEPFGEAAAFAGRNYPANASAMKATTTFFIEMAKFEGLLTRNPTLALNMLAILSRRLMIFARMIGELSLKEVPGRLATYLMILSHRNDGACDLTLDLPKSQLASLLGTIPETLSRILSKMQKEGLIKVQGSRITILDRERLEEISDYIPD